MRARSGTRSRAARCRRNPRSRCRASTRRRSAAGSSRGAGGLPDAAEAARTPAASDHWAFAPPSHPRPPSVRDGRRVRGPVDRFIQRALESRGLTLGPDADRPTLIRRLAFDLTGLPPSPAEVAAFVDDPSPGRLRTPRRSPAGQPPLRRALGQALAGCLGLRRLQRVLQRRHRPAAGLPLSRLRHPRVQRRSAARPGRPRATGRRRAGRRPSRAGDAARGGRPTDRHPLPPQQPGRHGRERRQPGRGPRRQVRRARGDRPGHRLVDARADDPVRPMPRPQVRAGHPGGLLPPPGDPVSGVQRRALGQAERPRR